MFKCFFLNTLSCYKIWINKPPANNDKITQLIAFADCIKLNNCYQNMAACLTSLSILPCYYFTAMFLSLLNNKTIITDSTWGSTLLLPEERNIINYGIASGLKQITTSRVFMEKLLVLYTLKNKRLVTDTRNPKAYQKTQELKSYIARYTRNKNTISNSYLCSMAREAKIVTNDCLFEHIFLYLGNGKIVGANFPSKEFIYDKTENVLKFTKSGMMQYSWNSDTYYLFASHISAR